MADYYPVFLDLRGRRCIVVGGGEVAERKTRTLLEHQARVTAISPRLSPGLEGLREQGAISVEGREYRPGDLEGAVLAIAATDDTQTNAAVAREGEERGLLVNVVDAPEMSSFIVPSLVHSGDVTIAISSGGKSPALARKIRTVLERTFGPEYGALALLLSEVRAELKKRRVRVDGESWQEALDLDTLLDLVKRGRREEAREQLMARLLAGQKQR